MLLNNIFALDIDLFLNIISIIVFITIILFILKGGSSCNVSGKSFLYIFFNFLNFQCGYVSET